MIKYFVLGLIAFLGLFASVPNAVAGDYATLEFIGFSENSKYMAFEEYGEEDLGGFYSSIYVIDTTKNTFAAPQIAARDAEDTMTSMKFIRGRTKLRAAKLLRKFGIVRGNVGNLIAAHLLTDWTYNNSLVKRDREPEKLKLNYYINPNSPNTYEYYELNLISNPLPKTAASPCGSDASTMELRLDYYMRGEKNRETIMLQKDTELPARRNCPYGYRIEQVYEYKNRIAVFINVFSQGFEGPDMRYLAVTGKWVADQD